MADGRWRWSEKTARGGGPPVLSSIAATHSERAIAQNAPVTLLNHPTGYHGFELQRDLGVPAARACALAGDGDAALEWLRSIPTRFLPASLATDSAFAAIQQGSEFRALFASPPG